MASIEKRGKNYIVRWRKLDGSAKTRTVGPSHDVAKKLQRAIEDARALGFDWEPQVARAVPALVEFDAEGELAGGLFADFLEARRGKLAPGTRQHYNRALLRFVRYLVEKEPRRRRLTVDLLTKDAIEGWFGSLVDDRLPEDERLGISTAGLMVTAVFSAWSWAYDSDTYGDDIGRPRRPELPVAPRTPAFAPSWEQMDAAIAAAYRLAAAARTSVERAGWLWRAQLLIVLRFTGLRVDEQVLQLQWDDVHLEAAELVIRGELGKSRRERSGRVVPLCPHLVEILAGWGVRQGYVIAPHLGSGRRSRSDGAPPYRHADPRHMRIIWSCARVGGEVLGVEWVKPPGARRGGWVVHATSDAQAVPERVWGTGPGRKKGNVHHAFRKGFKTGLSALGAGLDVRDFLVGHHRGIDEHYLDTYAQARAIVAKIPPLSDQVLEARAAVERERVATVVPFRRPTS